LRIGELFILTKWNSQYVVQLLSELEQLFDHRLVVLFVGYESSSRFLEKFRADWRSEDRTGGYKLIKFSSPRPMRQNLGQIEWLWHPTNLDVSVPSSLDFRQTFDTQI
jgi:hypothetical protein